MSSLIRPPWLTHCHTNFARPGIIDSSSVLIAVELLIRVVLLKCGDIGTLSVVLAGVFHLAVHLTGHARFAAPHADQVVTDASRNSVLSTHFAAHRCNERVRHRRQPPWLVSAGPAARTARTLSRLTRQLTEEAWVAPPSATAASQILTTAEHTGRPGPGALQLTSALIAGLSQNDVR